MRKISIGQDGFEELIKSGAFYVDKTSFIKEWWEGTSKVTLITRPRRFGKTLNMQMLECFFSNQYKDRGEELFKGLDIWNEEHYRALQGTYPVISLSFANVKEKSFKGARDSIIKAIVSVFQSFIDCWSEDTDEEKLRYSFMNISPASSDADITASLNELSMYLKYRYGKKCLIFLDEYDTPLQEAYVNGYWDDMSGFIRSLFNATFKTNPSMERAVLTGITRVSKESMLSDFNNPDVITTTSRKYETAFGLTEEEVDSALKEYGLSAHKEEVKAWYDGFRFGDRSDIYNPWSITKYLDSREFDTYWANTSSNDMISELVAGNVDIQTSMEQLMKGGTIQTEMNEEVVFSDLYGSTDAVWSLMVVSGYLKIVSVDRDLSGLGDGGKQYKLQITNGEVRRMFSGMIRRWFNFAESSTNEFVRAMIAGDIETMNDYMNDITAKSFSSFDSGNSPSESAPERFYHGFVLGLLVRENGRYDIRSNRESGFGRYDICMYPKVASLPGIVIEFKVQNKTRGENTLSDTADKALQQITDRKYSLDLVNAGVKTIYEYGFAFCGKHVLIKKE